jgi:hypothetical protein
MAAMGARKVARGEAAKAASAATSSPLFAPPGAVAGVHAVLPKVILVAAATLATPRAAIGVPIMRDGFISQTGILPSPTSTHTAFRAVV